ncbi:MAG TPA: thioesterase family protein [Candidatus Polarisedimenticolia bacterium]|nr:thioesterase family protein [Candidatus Polarisedimenticolia bacterium]
MTGEGWALAVPIEVRFKDIDSMGHVNNAVYFTYFENARIAYWKSLGLSRPRGDVAYVLARAECDFKSPATLDDDLVCHARVASFGRSSFAFEYLIQDRLSGREVATGRTVQVVYDYEASRVRPLDEPLKEAIRRFEGRDITASGRSR